MSIQSQKAGDQFYGLIDPGNLDKNLKKGSERPVKVGKLTPKQWTVIMLIAGFPENAKVLAEGLGTINLESGFDASSPGDGTHIGAWQEEPSFGSREDRLNPYKATVAARKRWAADGHSFYNAWTRWQIEQSGRNGAAEGVATYMGLTREILSEWHVNRSSLLGDLANAIGDVGGAIAGVPGDIIGSITSAEDFLVEIAKTLLDFKRLGQLAAEGFSWFLRLLAKALWDYVIAPLIHWQERAVSFYWTNFFGAGTERGSGFGYVLRDNAGVITITFWALGYAILWSDGTSLSPIDASGSMLGQAVKKIDGTFARRHLVKPEDVKNKTPKKPKPQTSTVQIERTKAFSVSRNRPVKVAPTGGEHVTGRNENERSHRVPRPGEEKNQKQNEEQKIILPSERRQKPAQESGTGTDSRVDSEGRAKDASVTRE